MTLRELVTFAVALTGWCYAVRQPFWRSFTRTAEHETVFDQVKIQIMEVWTLALVIWLLTIVNRLILH